MPIPDRAKRVWRERFGSDQKGVDDARVEIALAAYRDENSPFGWDIDHIKPKSQGGSDGYANLRPLNIPSNRSRNN